MSLRDLFLGLTVVLLWGFNIVTAKWGVAEVPPLLFTALRFAAVGVLVVPFFRLPRAALRDILLLSVTFGTGGFGLMFASFALVEGSTAAIVSQLVVPFSVLLGVFVLKEKPGPRRIFGIALALAGVLVIAGQPQGVDPLGIVLMVGSAACSATGNLFLKRLTQLPPLGVVGWMSLLATPQLLVLSLLLEDGHIAALQGASERMWWSLVYTVLAASIVAHSLWAGLVRRHELSRIVPFALLAPVTSVVCATIFLGEPLTPLKLVGGAITLTGVAIIQVRQAKKAPETAAEPARAA